MRKHAMILGLIGLLSLAGCGADQGAAAPSDAPAVTADTSTQSAAPESTQPAENPLLADFTATDLEGNEVTEDILDGYALTMVNVWATFCGPCITEMPELGELAAEYRDKGVQIVGMVSDTMASDGSTDPEQVALAQEIVAQTRADYLHFIPGEDLYGLLYQITSVPTTFFVDADGNQVGYAYLGAKDKAGWQAVIDQMLEEVGADT